MSQKFEIYKRINRVQGAAILGAVLFLGVIVAAIWLWNLRQSVTNLQNSVDQSRELVFDRDLAWSELDERFELVLSQAYELQSDFALADSFSWAPFIGKSIDGIDSIVEGSIIGIEALLPVVREVSSSDISIMRDTDALEMVITSLQENRFVFYAAAELIDSGIAELPADVMPELHQVIELSKGFRFIGDIVPVLPEAFAMESPKKFLVLGQTADELRPTGGFVSTIWVMTVHKGQVTKIDYKDTVAVDDLNHMNLYPKAPLVLQNHMQTCCLLMRDVSWDPDFPSVARLSQEIYYLGQKEKVDGVVAVNQWTLQKLVDFLGELQLADGEVIQAQEFQSFLQDRTDVEGRGYARFVMQSLMDKMVSSISTSESKALIYMVRDMLESKLVLLYFNDRATQELAESMGWTGSISHEDSDYLAVFDSNVGWSKVDGNISRKLSYEVVLNLETASKASLSVEYTNQSGGQATGCDEQWMRSRGSSYYDLTHACYWNYTRLYTPMDTRFVWISPLPLPSGSIYAVQGRGVPNTDTVERFSSHGKSGFGGLMVVPPGDSYRQESLYELPERVVAKLPSGEYGYSLVSQAQPGVVNPERRITVVVPEGYQLNQVTPKAALLTETIVAWVFTDSKDKVIEVIFEKSDN